jgi:hypothetical protein
VALVLVLPCFVVISWLHRVGSDESEACLVGWREWSQYFAVTIAVAAPWYLWAHWNLPGFTEEFFWRHNVVRYAGQFQHVKPWWYYLPNLLLQLLPWTALLVLPTLPRWRAASLGTEPTRLCWLAVGWCILFFSVGGCKQPCYLLPAMPPAALVIADLLRRCPLPLCCCCGGIAYSLVAIWAWHILPDHSHHASTGRPAYRFVRLAQREGLPIVAFRGTWEAAGFYRGGLELPVVGVAGGTSLSEFLQAHPRAWILARDYSHRIEELRNALPPEAVVDESARHGTVIGLRIATANR